MLHKLAEMIAESFAASPVTVIVGTLLLWALARLPVIRTFARDWSRQRENDIKEALELAAIGEAERKLLVEELNRLIIKRGLGFSASPLLRLRVLELVDRSGGELEVRTFARARQFLSMVRGQLHIRIDVVSYVEFFGHWTICIFFFISGAAIFATSAPRAGEFTMLQAAGIAGSVAACFLLASMFLFGTLPLLAARKIQRTIKCLPDSSAAQSAE